MGLITWLRQPSIYQPRHVRLLFMYKQEVKLLDKELKRTLRPYLDLSDQYDKSKYWVGLNKAEMQRERDLIIQEKHALERERRILCNRRCELYELIKDIEWRMK